MCYSDDLNASEIEETSVTLSWTAVAEAVSYDVRYRAGAAGDWIEILDVADSTTSLTGLESNTNYSWGVRTNCGTDTPSNYSGAVFQTLSGVIECIRPNTNAESTSNVTATTADITWEAAANAESYVVGYRIGNSGSFTEISDIIETNYTFEDLTPDTPYTWYVKTNCGGGNVSSFGAWRTFPNHA